MDITYYFFPGLIRTSVPFRIACCVPIVTPHQLRLFGNRDSANINNRESYTTLEPRRPDGNAAERHPTKMIELENLRTASLYINNQLLSRGLLRDGESIDFLNPGARDDDGAATMGRIMAVVNDLILRRDVSAPLVRSPRSAAQRDPFCPASLTSVSLSAPPARRGTSRDTIHDAAYGTRRVAPTSQRYPAAAGEERRGQAQDQHCRRRRVDPANAAQVGRGGC